MTTNHTPHSVFVSLGNNSYTITIGSDIISLLPEKMNKELRKLPVAIVSNPHIWDIYGKRLENALLSSGIPSFPILLPPGEEEKNLHALENIFTSLLKQKIGRKSLLIALGGGIVGDVTGFAAASFMRGVPFIQVPTSLLAMVDSSVGGKTGVNLPEGKNLVGAFYQPKHVLIDIETLNTLPNEEFYAGMAEVIKYSFISNHGKLLESLLAQPEEIIAKEHTVLKEMIAKCCTIKAQIVAEDEKEELDIRSYLNFGHTFGHAVEAVTEYKDFKHGEAVAIGMIYAAILSKQFARFQEEEISTLISLIIRYQLPTQPPKLPFDQYWEAMTHDKKAVNGTIRFTLLNAPGKPYMENNVTKEKALEAYQELFIRTEEHLHIK